MNGIFNHSTRTRKGSRSYRSSQDHALSLTVTQGNFFVEAEAYALPNESRIFRRRVSPWSIFYNEPHASLDSLFLEVKQVFLPKEFLSRSLISKAERIQQIKIIYPRLRKKAPPCLRTGAPHCEK